jgi:hypothetical protein
VIPETFGALLAFLGLVAPGLVYRTVIERRQPERNDSAFVETSRVALTSLVFSLASVAMLWLIQQFAGLALPDLASWVAKGTPYAAGNLGKVFTGLIGEVALACGLAALAAWILTRGSVSRFHEGTVWGTVFRRYRPKDFFAWVYVRLDNDVEFWGYERAHDAREKAEVRELVLAGKTLMRKLPSDKDWQPIGDHWDLVVINVERIRYMQIIYRDHAGRLSGAIDRDHPNGVLRAPSLPPQLPAVQTPPSAGTSTLVPMPSTGSSPGAVPAPPSALESSTPG